MFWILLPENRSQTNNFFAVEKSTSRSMVWHQPRFQDLFPGLGAGREKALASAGHVPTLVVAPAGFWPRGQNPRRHYSLPRVYV